MQTEEQITEEDSIHFLRILKNNVASLEHFAEEETTDTYMQNRAKKEAAIILKFLSAFKNYQASEDVIGELKKEIIDLKYEQAKDRQRIAKLEGCLLVKNNGRRRDFDLLAVDLKNEVLRRGKRGMTADEVLSFFRFRHRPEAYRLIDRTTLLFHEDVRIRKPKSQKQVLRITPFEI